MSKKRRFSTRLPDHVMRFSRSNMRSTNSHAQLAEQHTDEPLAQVEYIRIAADLLDQLFSEIRTLAIDHPEFARALSNRSSDARARLQTLNGIVSLLVRGEPSTAGQLTRRATALISGLSATIDELTLTALGDYDSLETYPCGLH
jgi:hypothetical protein